MAYSDRLRSGWKPYNRKRKSQGEDPGKGGVIGFATNRVSETCDDHMASPHVIYRSDINQFVLFFHCPNGTHHDKQRTYVALSDDGQKFTLATNHGPEDHIGEAYGRILQIPESSQLRPSYQGKWLAFARKKNNKQSITMTIDDLESKKDGLGPRQGTTWYQRGCDPDADPIDHRLFCNDAVCSLTAAKKTSVLRSYNGKSNPPNLTAPGISWPPRPPGGGNP